MALSHIKNVPDIFLNLLRIIFVLWISLIKTCFWPVTEFTNFFKVLNHFKIYFLKETVLDSIVDS